MTRRAAIAALALAALFAAVGARDAHAEWVTEVVTNQLHYDGVEYLQNDSNLTQGRWGCFIDSVKPAWNTKTILKYRLLSTSGTAPTVVGSESPWKYWIDSNGRHYFQNTNIEVSRSANVDYTEIFNDENHKCWINGTLRGTFSVVYQTRINTPLCLFAEAWSTTSSGYDYSAYCRIYFLRTYEDGVVTSDLIPVKIGSAGYFYDRVSGALYGNKNTAVSLIPSSVTGNVYYVSLTTNRVYRAPAPMRSFDAAHPFNNAAARTRLGGTGNGEDGTTLRPTAHFDIKKNEED